MRLTARLRSTLAPERPWEAVSRRRLLLAVDGRDPRHAGETTLVLTNTHPETGRVQPLLTEVSHS